MSRCAETVKDQYGRKVSCDTPLKQGTPCPKKDQHLKTYTTGFCSAGMHEGLNPKNKDGKPLPTCTSWQTCVCTCHDSFSEMYAMAERDRAAVNNSSYVPDHGDFTMPSYEELAAMRVSSRMTGPETVTVLKSELPEAVPATIARSFAPTPTGRAARGELEAQVKEVCDAWLVDTLTDSAYNPCTPKYVSAEIGRKYGIKAPSVGAIDAVWKRWAKIGFAVIEVKPTRFTGYTPAGIEHTLDGMKERARRVKI